MGIIHACFGECGPVGIILTIHSWLNTGRAGCVCRTIGLDQVRTVHPLVLPLSYIRRSRLRLYCYLFLGIPVQKAGWCARCSSCTAARFRLHFKIRYFGRDRSTAEGAQYQQTKLLPPDHRSRRGSRDGFLHSDLYRVRTRQSPPPVARQILFSFRVHSVEITLGGWVVTYIIKVRGGGPSSGYISSGYWGGLTLGRVGLLWVNKLVGERRAIFLYCALTIVYKNCASFSSRALI